MPTWSTCFRISVSAVSDSIPEYYNIFDSSRTRRAILQRNVIRGAQNPNFTGRIDIDNLFDPEDSSLIMSAIARNEDLVSTYSAWGGKLYANRDLETRPEEDVARTTGSSHLEPLIFELMGNVTAERRQRKSGTRCAFAILHLQMKLTVNWQW